MSERNVKRSRSRNTWRRPVDDPSLYASAAERMVEAIGEPIHVDTASDPRLGRIFMNRTIKTYRSLSMSSMGWKNAIERIVGFFRHAAQGLEERKQILYLLGPVVAARVRLPTR